MGRAPDCGPIFANARLPSQVPTDGPAERRAHMSFLAWIGLGLIAGFIASLLVNRRGGSLLLDLLLGVIGAFVGGFLFTRFGAGGVSGFNLYSIAVATVGAVVVLFVYHLIFRRSGSS